MNIALIALAYLAGGLATLAVWRRLAPHHWGDRYDPHGAIGTLMWWPVVIAFAALWALARAALWITRPP